MASNARLLCFALVSVGCGEAVLESADPPSDLCPPGMAFSIETEGCAPIRQVFDPTPISAELPPRRVRDGIPYSPAVPFTSQGSGCASAGAPSSTGARFNPGMIVTQIASLQTRMTIRNTGIGNT